MFNKNKNINIDTNPINILVPLQKVQNNFVFIFFYINTAIDKAISFNDTVSCTLYQDFYRKPKKIY